MAANLRQGEKGEKTFEFGELNLRKFLRKFVRYILFISVSGELLPSEKWK
jgi:hypothetical protein